MTGPGAGAGNRGVARRAFLEGRGRRVGRGGDGSVAVPGVRRHRRGLRPARRAVGGMFLTSKDPLAEGRFGAMFKRLPAFTPPDDLLSVAGGHDGRGPDGAGRQPTSTPARGCSPATPSSGSSSTTTSPSTTRRWTQQQADPDAQGQLPDAALRPRLRLRPRSLHWSRSSTIPRTPCEAAGGAQRQRGA